MRTPNEIGREALRDELYARTRFATLIALSPPEFRVAIESDPRAQTEFMARHIIEHHERYYMSIPPEHALELLRAARTASRNGEAYIRCHAEKQLAVVLCHLTRFAEADATLCGAAAFAAQSIARAPHEALVAYGRAIFYNTIDEEDRATHYLEYAISVFEQHGAHDRAYSAREYDAFRRAWRGQHACGLAAFQDVARRARNLGRPEELGRSYQNIGLCYRGLGDFVAAQRHFRKAARIHRNNGIPALEAKALRCAARMAIRLHGTQGATEMEKPKDIFLGLGAAGEVCRCTVAVMEEIVLFDPRSDIRGYAKQLEEEATALGVLPIALHGIVLLKEFTASGGIVDADILDRVWDAFGPTSGMPAISAVDTVRN